MPKKAHEKTHLHHSGRALLPAANAHWRVDSWQIQMWRKSFCTGDSGWENSKDPIKYCHKFSSLAKERWDATPLQQGSASPYNDSCIFLFSTPCHSVIDPANLRSRGMKGLHVVSFSWLMVCSSLSLRTTLKTQIHQAQRNWRLPRELLTAQCKVTHEDTVTLLPWVQHKNFLVQRNHNKEGGSKNVWKNLSDISMNFPDFRAQPFMRHSQLLQK